MRWFFPVFFFFLWSSPLLLYSHLVFPSLLSLLPLFSITSDWSQTRQFAHYHKIMGRGHWADPGKTWPWNTTKSLRAPSFCSTFHPFFLSSFLFLYPQSSYFRLHFFFLPPSSNSNFPPNSCHDQIHRSGISHSEGTHSLSQTLVSILAPIPPAQFTQRWVMENNFASNWNCIYSEEPFHCLVMCLLWWRRRMEGLVSSPPSSAITPTNSVSPSPMRQPTLNCKNKALSQACNSSCWH